MSDAPWYERFFGDNYLDVYGHQLSAEGAEHEASFVERALALKAGESLLDLCCGPGRHALLLAQRGLRVTAPDLSQPYLEAAAAEAQRRGIEDETVYLEHRELNLVTSRNHVTFIAVAPDGSRHDLDGHHIRLYTLTELIGMLAAAGLRLERVYGGFDGEVYGVDTRRMIVVATKP